MSSEIMGYDSKGDTLEHINNVRRFIDHMIRCLMDRAQSHDASKLESPEKEFFDKYTPLLSGVSYGSDEYRDMLAKMKPAIDHHQECNRHHPEYFKNGIRDMDLIDLMEMICDWKAATLRHNDGDIRQSLRINAERHNIPPAIVRVLENTIAAMEGW